MVLISISLMVSNVEHLFMCFLAICMSSLANVFSGLLPVFQSGFFLFLILGCMSFFYILGINSLPVTSFAKELPLSRLPFHFVDGFLCSTKPFK